MRHLWSFVAISAAVIATPGPDTALTVRNSVLVGRRGGVYTALGVCTGQAMWTLTTCIGVTALVEASRTAFLALRVVGAAYLVFLGGQALLTAFGRRPDRGAIDRGPRTLTDARAYRQGFISNVSNPKMIAFFVSLLPQFAPGRAPVALLTLGLIFAALTFLWLCGYAFAVAKLGALVGRPSGRRTVSSLTGVVLIAFGVRLITEPAR